MRDGWEGGRVETGDEVDEEKEKGEEEKRIGGCGHGEVR